MQCVNLGTYETNKVVTFIPPDGEFELMRWVRYAAVWPVTANPAACDLLSQGCRAPQATSLPAHVKQSDIQRVSPITTCCLCKDLDILVCGTLHAAVVHTLDTCNNEAHIMAE